MVSTPGQSSSLRVLHVQDGNDQFERVEWMDGTPRLLLRLNDAVYTLWPEQRSALLEQRDATANFPALFSGGEQRILEWYELHQQGLDRTAGLPAEVMLLKARDKLRYSQRLWAERRTGLLLRSEVLTEQGQVLEAVAFTDLSIGIRPAGADLHKQLQRLLAGYKVVQSQAVPTRLDQEGWRLSGLPAGFQQVQCARRGLDALAPDTSPIVLQTIFADGLTHVSIFIEPFDAKRHQAEGVSANGATATLSVKRGEHWLTAVGDVPVETLKKFVQAFERRR